MRLVKREGMAAMFQSCGGDYWEVHRVRVEPAQEVFGKAYPEREALAGNAAFGTYGWACSSLDRAECRFKDAIAHQDSEICQDVPLT